MNSITISLPRERWVQLKGFADQAGVSPEELLRARVEAWLEAGADQGRDQDQFRRAAEYVLAKNTELYRRLA